MELPCAVFCCVTVEMSLFFYCNKMKPARENLHSVSVEGTPQRFREVLEPVLVQIWVDPTHGSTHDPTHGGR